MFLQLKLGTCYMIFFFFCTILRSISSQENLRQSALIAVSQQGDLTNNLHNIKDLSG